MKKMLFSIFLLMIVSIAACQQAVKKETAPADAMKKEMTALPQADTTGNTAVDAVGKGLSNVDSVDKDLSADQLGDLDSGLADVQKI